MPQVREGGPSGSRVSQCEWQQGTTTSKRGQKSDYVGG